MYETRTHVLFPLASLSSWVPHDVALRAFFFPRPREWLPQRPIGVCPKTTRKVTYFLDHTTSTSWKAIGYTFSYTSVSLRQNEQQGEAQNWCQQRHQQREHNHGFLPEYSSHPRTSPFDAWNTIGNRCAHEMFSCWDPLATGHKDSLPSSSAIFYQQSAVELKFEAFTLAHVCWRSAPGSNCSARPVRAPWRAHWEASTNKKLLACIELHQEATLCIELSGCWWWRCHSTYKWEELFE